MNDIRNAVINEKKDPMCLVRTVLKSRPDWANIIREDGQYGPIIWVVVQNDHGIPWFEIVTDGFSVSVMNPVGYRQ